MYDMNMDKYAEFSDQFGLQPKNKGNDDWMYFYRKWESQLHDILNLTITESISADNVIVEFDWMKVFKADWYQISEVYHFH